MATKKLPKEITATLVPVEIEAAKEDGTPVRFSMVAYNGGALDLPGFEYPVVVDLQGAKFHKSVKANLNHDRKRMVGHVDQAEVKDGKILMAGAISAATEDAEQVLASHKKGYPWEASIQADRLRLEILARNKTAIVNGQEFTGPKYIARESNVYAVAFCDQGADDSTEVMIAASAASSKEMAMFSKPEIKAWAEKVYAGMYDPDHLTPELAATIEANYAGFVRDNPKKVVSAGSEFESRKLEAQRQKDIREIAATWADKRVNDLEWIASIEKMSDQAIEAKMGVQEFRNQLYESCVPLAHTVSAPRNRDTGITDRVIMAALCETGRLSNIEKHFTDQELQAGRDHFGGGIGPAQLLLLGAESHGYHRTGGRQVTKEVLEYAFPGKDQRRHIRAAGGYSALDISTIVSATANKFMMDGWNSVDRTCLRIASIRPVTNFQQVTTVSLTDSVRYEQIGADGEIKHGTGGQITYTNQADTYARMLAITRKDIINDDAGALTSAPKKLGNGAIKLLNHIFWTEFLSGVSASFFAVGNSNINTGVADMTVGGLDATETIFMNQTNPDGTPLGLMPAILLVPTALKNKALTLMGSQLNGSAITSYGAAVGDSNPFAGRFRVESSPYISNSSYTGYTSQAWWMLANPSEMAVIEICALNGRVEPTVDTADADFNTLGVQMRGYCDVGVNLQEYRGGVHADGNAS